MYLQKLAADFEVIKKLVERKHLELRDKIEMVFDENLQLAYRYIDGLTAMKQTIQQVNEQANHLKLDVDQLQINTVLKSQLKEIQLEFDFDVQTSNLDLIESRFINEPFQKLERCLLKYDFAPIRQSELENLKKQFILGGTKILEPKHFTPEFFLNIMP